MSEAADMQDNLFPLKNASPERQAPPGSTLRDLTDTGLDDTVIAESLQREVIMKELMSIGDKKSRARYLVNATLVAVGATYHFADLKEKGMPDAIRTSEVTKLLSSTELFLENVEHQGTLRDLNAMLFDVYDDFEDTNLVRAIEQLEARYRTTCADELVHAKRLVLLMLKAV